MVEPKKNFWFDNRGKRFQYESTLRILWSKKNMMKEYEKNN